MFTEVVCAALMASAIVYAQGETGPNNSTTPTFIENEIVVHTVTVGYITDAFQPNSINVNPGDKVMFKFWPGNHSVIESLYGWPCVPRGSVNGQQGFNSGFNFADTVPDNPSVWNLTITSTDPIFYYCGAPGSCINYGMLGVINPQNNTDLTAQINLAKQSKYYLEPNDSLPAAAAASISSLAANILPSETAIASAVPTNATAAGSNNSNNSSGGLSAGAIAGIAIGAVAGVALLGAAIFFIGRSRGQVQQLQETLNRQSQAPPPVPKSAPEMTVDGVTYVPAHDPRASVQKGGFLPPYQQYQQDRSRSPETVSNYGSPMQFVPQPMYSPGLQSQSRFSEHSEMMSSQMIHAPVPRHELSGEAILREEAESHQDLERGPRTE